MDFHPDLRESGNKMLKKNALVKRGTTSGRVLVDTETYDHGFKGSPGSFIKEGFSTQVHVFLKGAGISLLLHHHGDQAIMGSGSIKMQPGLTATGKPAARIFLCVSRRGRGGDCNSSDHSDHGGRHHWLHS